MDPYIKGRGSQTNPANKFLKNSSEKYLDDLPTEEEREAEILSNPKTKYIEVFPKTILNKVTSPDIGLAWSMNPYQGCEHGCIYCYARNSHEYWGFSAGMDFEQNVLIKKSAPQILRDTLLNKKWKVDAIMMAGNTDCYQPAERKFEITRQCLQVFADLKHPIGIITKNSLIERDIDILSELASQGLVSVTLSLTTLNEQLKRIMEPRTSAAHSILRTIKKLSEAGVPVHVNNAPIVPAINDEEIFDLVKAVADHGALSAGFIVVRLNGHNGQIFTDWVTKNFPDRANKVLNQVKDMHDGKLNDSNWGRRMKGEGRFAEIIRQQYTMARNKFLAGHSMPFTNYSLFEPRRQQIWDSMNPEKQLKLF